MIDKKDCCGNCIEGLDSCCDEELSQEIEDQIGSTDVTTDIAELARHLCCPNKFYHITNVMKKCNKQELIQLQLNLSKFVKLGRLHPSLESKFRHAIARN